MPRRRVALILLACTLVAATGLRGAAGAEKRGLTHDESISYLAAACHQGDYARLTLEGRPPLGRWVLASQWKELLRPERAGCLGTIARDLAHEDIHPPLYFWLLHAWALAFGVGLWTGPSLNIVLAALTTLALFGLARRVLGDPLRAALVAFVWSFSPAAIRVFAEARQYELLALLATLFVWQCVRVADPAPRRQPLLDLGVLAALTLAGALSQLLFALVAAAGVAVVLVRRRKTGLRPAVGALGGVVAGYVAFALFDSGFVDSLARGRAQATPPSVDLLGGRLEATVRTLAEFLLPPGVARGPLALLAAVGILAVAAWLVLRRWRSEPAVRWEERAVVLVFAWLFAANAALFLLFVSPASAMDVKHMSTVWPVAAFGPVLAVVRVPRRARAPVAIACAAALTAAGAVAALGATARPPGLPPTLERAHALVLDNVARGVLPRVVWRVPDRTRVFAADQRHLMAHPDAWLRGLASGGLLVAGIAPSDPRYGNGPELARRVLAEVARRHRLAPVPDPLEPGHVYHVAPAVERR